MCSTFVFAQNATDTKNSVISVKSTFETLQSSLFFFNLSNEYNSVISYLNTIITALQSIQNTPINNTTVYNIGTRNTISTEFSFNSSNFSPTHIVGSADLTTIRDWLGISDGCAPCYPGYNKSQNFSFTNVLNKEIKITMNIQTVKNSSTFYAEITNGSANIVSGNSKLFSQNLPADTWDIVIRPTTNSLNLKLTNNLNSGTNYIYVDNYIISISDITSNNASTNTNVFVGANIGTKNNSTLDFVFSSPNPTLTHVVGSGDLNTVRDWIGHSMCSPLCYPGTTKQQIFQFNNVPTSKDINVKVNIINAAGNSTFSAGVYSGNMSIVSGATKQISSTISTDTWNIKIRPIDTNFSIILGNGLTTGTNYFYVDSYEITVLERSCTFNGQEIANTSSVIAYQQSTVSSPMTCVSETRICSGGVLSGSYTNSSCTVSAPNVISTVTNTHRYSPQIYGGWGHHLGHLLRNLNGDLFYVDDTGSDVNINAGLDYFKQSNGSWQKVASKSFVGGTVQQNTGSIINGNIIYTYGVNTQANKIQECTFDTTTNIGSCQNLQFDTGINSNYIGATISRNGTRLVWWTNVSTSSPKFNYIYNFGGGWNGPQSGNIAGYPDYSYVLGRMPNDSSVDFIGLSAKALGGSSSGYDVLTGSTILGNPVNNWSLFGTQFASENWLDETLGNHYIFQNAGITYYAYRAFGGQIIVQYALPQNTVSARLMRSVDGLYLITTKNDGSISKRLYLNSGNISSPIDFRNIAESNLNIPTGLGVLYMFPESNMYQNNISKATGIVVNGTNSQNILYYIPLE